MKKALIWSMIVLVSAFYYFVDPEKSGIGIPCTFKAVTGLNCVGCGGQRTFHFLLHGEFLKAARYNFLIYLFPFFFVSNLRHYKGLHFQGGKISHGFHVFQPVGNHCTYRYSCFYGLEEYSLRAVYLFISS